MISIVIPVYNQHEMTRDCLDAVIKNTSDFEIVLIDNGSQPPILPMIDGEYIVNRVRNETNLGFPVAVNQGIRAAKGDVIVLLNNDVIVSPGWANRMIRHLDTYSIVGPMTNYCAGLQQGLILPVYDDDKGMFIEAEKWGREHSGESMEVNFIIGFLMVFKKSLFDEIGEFDESLWPCSGEEIDFCLRARKAGHRVGIARDAYVHHIGSVTLAQMEREGQLDYIKVCTKNDEHLAKTWGHNFWAKQVGEFIFDQTDPLKKAVRLNLGCGVYHLHNFINIDQYPHVKPDIVADALNLPFERESVDEIYCGHLLEHLTFGDGQKALGHWRSLLKKGGVIGITVPDFDVLAKRYLDDPTPERMRKMNDWYIYSYVQESHHQYCYGKSLLKMAMEAAGFRDLKTMPYTHPYFTSAEDDQISYQGVK
jgi:GT2 family glycosyltransferase/predicted SAM-dependent methyltransferase